MLKKWIVAIALFTAAVPPLLPVAPQQANPPANADLLTFEAGPNGLPLEEFIERASAVLDAPIFFERRWMAGLVVHFDGKVEVPREKFLAFFEERLFEKHFVHLERNIGPVQFHSVVRLGPKRENNLELKTIARRVDCPGLLAVGGREAPVIARLWCDPGRAEAVAAAIGPRLDESLVEDVRHVEGTNAVLVHAFAKKLGSLLPELEVLGARLADLEAAAPTPSRTAVPGVTPVPLHRAPAGLPLKRFVEAVTRVVGEPVFYDRIDSTRVDFAGEILLDRTNALAWLDAAATWTDRSRERRPVADQPVSVLRRHASNTRLDPRRVTPEQLATCDGEYVSTMVLLQRLPSSAVVDSICCRFGGLDQDSVRAIEPVNAFVMSGAADKLAVYAALALDLDRNATLEERRR